MQTEQDPQQLNVENRFVARYTAAAVALVLTTLAIPVILGLPLEPFLLLTTIGVLFGGAVLTAQISDPGGVRRLLTGALHWKIGWANWAIAVAALPVATVAVAAVTGTYIPPPDGWLFTVGSYLFATLIFGTLLLNLWEEAAWQGLVQRHLERRHGPIKGAALTAIPFAVVHIPIAFVGGVSLGEGLVTVALILAYAPVFRYVMGRTDRFTGRSLLAVGVMHAAFNASGSLDVLDGGWQHIAGMAVVGAVLFAADSLRARSAAGSPNGRETLAAGVQ